MILVDTSAWVEFDRGTGTSVNHRVRELIAEPGLIAVTEPVAMEVLVGVSNVRAQAQWRQLFARCGWLPFDSASDFAGAESIYRTCRRSGVTPRGLIDCMIATVALRLDAAVLSHDRDFGRLAEVVGLRLDPASLR